MRRSAWAVASRVFCPAACRISDLLDLGIEGVLYDAGHVTARKKESPTIFRLDKGAVALAGGMSDLPTGKVTFYAD